MIVTLQQLRYFLAAVERGSVSAAAEACFVSQPSLSEQLRRLEQGLGVAPLAYLAGDDSSFVTGAELMIDGGYLAR